jgi:hypothetical protein
MTNIAPSIIGFDLGHAETALAIVKDARGAELGLLDLPSGRRRPVMVTAVAVCDDGVRVGYPAIDTDRATVRFAAFKSPDLHLPSVSDPVRHFVSAVRDEVRREGHLPVDRPVKWVFGAPSGWTSMAVDAFRGLLEEQGFRDVEVVRESRAAMLYARDSGDFSFHESDLSKSVLVIDLGSSTTDFTLVEGLVVKAPDDARTGHRLGASLIDRAILDWTLRSHPRAEELLHWLNASPQTEWSRLEFACRWAKEDYFRNEAGARDGDPVSGGWVYRPIAGDGAVLFEVTITREVMTELLRKPMVDGNNWAEQFRHDLREALPPGFRPDIVLMTGGASRMPFVGAIVREEFGNERVIVGAEPGLAIARGLAIAGRIGYRAAGFRDDISELLASGRVQSLVGDRLQELADAVGLAVADGFFEKFVLPAFARFKSGDIATLAELENEIGEAVRADLTESNPKIISAVMTWMNQVGQELAQLTEPICDRWRVPRSLLSLTSVPVGGDSLTAIPVSGYLTGVVGGVGGAVAGIVAYLVTSFAAALLVTGPIGATIALITMLVAAIAAVRYGHRVTADTVKTMRLPVPARRLLTEGKLRRKAPELEAKLRKDVAGMIVADREVIVTQIALRLDGQLREQAAAAELLIS